MPSVTLTFDTIPAQRIGAALGKELNLVDANGQPRSANVAEYKDWLRDMTRRMVMGVEDRNARAAVPPPSDVVIT